MDNQYELLDTIIKSRLLAFDDEGYEDLLMMDVDSFRKRYRDASDEKLKTITKAFCDAFEEMDALGPQYMILSYMEASDVFGSVGFDWGKCKQLATRRKFCRWMFTQAYLNNPHLHDGGYTARKEDWALFERFKPDADDDREAIDIVFTMLLTFQVIRPFGSDSVRALKYASTSKSRERMIMVLELLEEDLPVFGITKTLISLSQALCALKDPEFDDDMFPPAALWGMLHNVAVDLQTNSSPAELLDSHVELNGYAMRGIWVDDSPAGHRRFWVFPNNKLMAFCYSFRRGEWILEPYEFVFSKLEYEDEFADTCAMATVRGNEQALLNGKIEDTELARLTYELEDRDEEGQFQTIRFEPETGSEYPYWMDWRSFRRLPLADSRTGEYAEVIEAIYRGAEMFNDFGFRNIAPWLTDSQDCLVGLDCDFLYLVDFALDRKGCLEKISGNGEYLLYDYCVDFSRRNKGFGLFGVEISEEQPIYVVSRNPLFYEGLNERLKAGNLVEAMPNKADRNAFLRRYEDFKETVFSTEFSDQVTIYKGLRTCSASMLCFNKISRNFLIDELTEWFGVRKFTSREEMLKSDLFSWRQSH